MSTRVLLSCGALGPALFVIVFLVEGALRPGYRPWRHFVSLLALGDRGWIQATSFIVCGALVLAFTIAVARVVDSVALPVLFAVFGAGLIVSGLFAADPALGYPPGTVTTWPPAASRRGTVHNVAGLLVFSSLAAACFVYAHAAGGMWRAYSIATGALVPVLFVASGVLAERTGRGELADAPVGVAQRLAIVIGWTWVVGLALHLARASGVIV